MSQTLQLEELQTDQAPAAPALLVDWTPRWQSFVTSIRPALARSERRLAGEAPFGLIPLRIMVPSYVLEALGIFLFLIVQVKIAELRPYVASHPSSHDVIYYSGEELPRTQDLGGAEAGTTGSAGGGEAHHRTQTIKIARGGSLVPKEVDAPNLKLPSSPDAVANLLALKPNPGPPPVEGLRSTRSARDLAVNVVAPAPNAIRDYTRNNIPLDAVIPPAPSVSGPRLTTPDLSGIVIPPAADVHRENVLVAPALTPAVIPPAPSVNDRRRSTASLNSSVIAPAPTVDRDHSRSATTLAANVIPPSPGGVSRELSNSPVQMTNRAVIPPPVSAPERAGARTSRLNMPASSVIAPPPSAEISPDVHRLPGSNNPDPSKTVIAPPPSTSGSLMSTLIGKIFGPAEVVPPPPNVSSNNSESSAGRAQLAANVVPPPPTTAGGSRSGTALAPNVVAPPPSAVSGGRSSTTLAPNVVAPPPTAALSETSGRRSNSRANAPSIVPPPPSVSGSRGNSGTQLAGNVVPPPPSLSGGRGRTGAGLGAPLDAGANLAPANTAGSTPNAGAVISTQPGAKLALPNTSTGSLAMSPAGSDKPGLGGADGGESIGRGKGPGSGMNGAGSGAGKSGSDHGSDPVPAGGISSAAGPGGAGNMPSGSPAVRGIDISGGTSQVTLPSFGTGDDAPPDSQAPGQFPRKPKRTFDVDVIATANSGGAFEPYKNLLKGEKHTIYPETSSSLGAAAMEYSAPYAGRSPLMPPQSINTDLPAGLPKARMVVACILDVSGNLKGIRVLEPGPADMTAKVLAALRAWKFEPATRDGKPVEVTAILGFGINTNDRF